MTGDDHVHFGQNILGKERTKESTVYQPKMTVAEKETEIARTWSEEPYGVEERDYKKKQVRFTSLSRIV